MDGFGVFFLIIISWIAIGSLLFSFHIYEKVYFLHERITSIETNFMINKWENNGK